MSNTLEDFLENNIYHNSVSMHCCLTSFSPLTASCWALLAGVTAISPLSLGRGVSLHSVDGIVRVPLTTVFRKLIFLHFPTYSLIFLFICEHSALSAVISIFLAEGLACHKVWHQLVGKPSLQHFFTCGLENWYFSWSSGLMSEQLSEEMGSVIAQW